MDLAMRDARAVARTALFVPVTRYKQRAAIKWTIPRAVTFKAAPGTSPPSSSRRWQTALALMVQERHRRVPRGEKESRMGQTKTEKSTIFECTGDEFMMQQLA